MLWITDPTHVCTFVSRGWYEFTGQTPADGTQYGWLNAVHPADREATGRAFAAAAADRRPFAVDYRLRRADGEYRWVIDAGRPWAGPAGEFRGYVGSVIDIEDRKRAEQATRLSEQRFTEFLNHLPANGWVKDAAGRYLFVNESVLHSYGVAADHFVGRTDHNLFPPDVADALAAHDADVLATGRPVRSQEVIPDPAAGAARHMTVVKFPVAGPAGQPAVGGIGLDVTEQVRATERAVQAQKLESLGVLAGGIAHDFNNILTAVLGYASLARQEANGSAALTDYLAQIETAAQRAGELCAQMLAYAGKGRQTTATVDLNQLVREMAQLLAAAIGKSAVLRYQFADDLPPVTVDATQIRQVVMNLITNAADAIGERGGVITLTTGELDADARYLAELGAPDLAPGRYVSLEVSDTGCGMTAETAARVFEPFFTTKFTGRGLGMSAVRGILKQHRGAIKVYSAVGQGTTVKVLLPLAADAPPPRPTSAPGVPDRFGGGRLILVVDDEEAIRTFARRLLERAGFAVELAADGRDGLEAFRRRPEAFAAVLLDLTMPHLDGADTFRELRRVRADVPVILSSGFGKDDATAGLEGKGLAGFVRKPFRVQELLGTLRAVVGASPG
ncbi:MAG: PAS domain S-box protein [Gemmataceae bacterium]